MASTVLFDSKYTGPKTNKNELIKCINMEQQFQFSVTWKPYTVCCVSCRSVPVASSEGTTTVAPRQRPKPQQATAAAAAPGTSTVIAPPVQQTSIAPRRRPQATGRCQCRGLLILPAHIRCDKKDKNWPQITS